MKKPKKAKAKKPSKKKAVKATAKQAKSAVTPSGSVPGKDVADFICREGGASMAELVENFGIDAHPMRAKIHYARHKLGYSIETKDGRYFGTPPKVETA